MLVVVMIFGFHTEGHGITYTFIGTGNWSDPSKWDMNGVPPPGYASDNIIIQAMCNANVAVAFNGTLIINTGITLTIKSGSSLTINSGGNLNNYGTLTNNGGLINVGTLTNFSSGTFNNKGNLVVEGSLDNNSTLTNNLGCNLIIVGTLTNHLSGTLQNDGTLTINSGSTLQNDGTLTNNSGGILQNDGTLINNSGGILTNNSGGTLQNNVTLTNNSGGTFSNSGTLNNSGGTLNNNGTLTNTSSGTLYIFNNGTLTNNGPLTNNYFVSISNGTLQNNHTLTNTSSGTLQNNSTLTNNSGGTLQNNHILTNNTSGTLNNNGTLNNISSSTLNNNGTLNNISSSALNNNGTLNNKGSVNNNGTLNNNSSGTLTYLSNGTLTNTETINNNGTLKGTGTLVQSGTFSNSSTGIIAPGASPGKLTITGSLNLGSGAYNCEIYGTTQGTTYDWLAISGIVTLTNAQLAVNWGSFVPFAGDEFTILTCGSRTGEFTSVTIPSVSGLQFTVLYGATSVVIQAQALPVELVKFTGKERNGGVMLEWNTASEQNNKGFEILCSDDGDRWTKIGFINGHGSTTEEHSYSFLDTKPLNAENYYRLRQIDLDGKEEFSKIIMVQFSEEAEVSLFPNPVHSSLSIDDFSEQTEYLITGVTGQTLKGGILSPGDAIDVQQLANGLYYIAIGRKVMKFVKN